MLSTIPSRLATACPCRVFARRVHAGRRARFATTERFPARTTQLERDDDIISAISIPKSRVTSSCATLNGAAAQYELVTTRQFRPYRTALSEALLSAPSHGGRSSSDFLAHASLESIVFTTYRRSKNRVPIRMFSFPSHCEQPTPRASDWNSVARSSALVWPRRLANDDQP